jgi:nicotinamidase-related amidase
VSTKTALLIIDAQVGLLEKAHRRDEVVARIADLIARANAVGAPIIYVQHDSDDAGDLLEIGSPGWRIHPAIAPAAADLVVHKRSSDAFYQTSLQQELNLRGVTHLIVGGMKTEMCVDTTCRAAVSHGFDVTLAADAHTTTGTETLPAAQMIAYHNEILDDFGNDDHVVTTKEVRAIPL